MNDLISHSELISRSELIRYINDNVIGASDWAKEIRQDFIDMVEKQSIAYDVDKVVAKLEERKADNIRISNLSGNSNTKKISHICRSDEDDYAIGIVKGGLEE